MIAKISDFLDEHMEIIGIAVFVLIIGIFVGGIVWTVMDDSKTWNDGYCECGGRWVYFDTEHEIHGNDGSVYTTTRYIYRCEDCGKMHKFGELR